MKILKEVCTKEEAEIICKDFVFYDVGNNEIIVAKKDIAALVANTEGYAMAKIFDSEGNQILSTLGCFVDKFFNISNDDRNELLKEIIAYQKGEKVCEEIKFIMEDSDFDFTD